MGRVKTNDISLAYAIELTPGVLPGSPVWKLLEPNNIGSFGANISTTERSPISKSRQRRKGTVTDLDSPVEFEGDLTMDSLIDFIEGFAFASANGGAVFSPTAAVATGFTVAAGGDLAQDTLVYSRGWTTPANNGLKEVVVGSTTTEIKIEGGLTAETPDTVNNATVEVAGFRGASGDLEIDANGDLTSTVLDFTTLDLTVGQAIFIGGEATVNQFAAAADRGFARVTAIAVAKLTLDKKTTTFIADTGVGKLIDIYFGRFIRNVSVDDVDYLEQSFQFELTYPNLETPGPGDEYEYAIGNLCNAMSFRLPLTDKATIGVSFVGMDTEPPSTTRASGADAPLQPVATGAFNTSADIMRLRVTEVDETGLTTDFKSITLVLNNGATPEKVLGNLGAKYINTGNLEVDLESQLLFSNSGVAAAIRENRTVTLDFVLKNDDGGVFFDIPAVTLGGGGRSFPVNESVLIDTTARAFGDPILGTSFGASIFPFVPTL